MIKATERSLENGAFFQAPFASCAGEAFLTSILQPDKKERNVWFSGQRKKETPFPWESCR